MNRTQVLVLTGAALFMALVLVSFSASRPKPDRPRDAPTFELPADDGSSYALAAHRGTVVLLNFWATWCPPCVAETPSLEAMHRRFSPRGLQVIGVSVDDEWAVVRDFMRKHDVTYRVLLDPRAVIAHRYGTFKYPESYLIDREGRIVKTWIGQIDWRSAEVMAELESALTPR